MNRYRTWVDALAYARVRRRGNMGGQQHAAEYCRRAAAAARHPCCSDATDKHAPRKITGTVSGPGEHNSGWSNMTVSSAAASKAREPAVQS